MDKVATMLFGRDELFDAITTLEQAQHEIRYMLRSNGDRALVNNLTRTSNELTDLILRFNMATLCLTNEPDKV